jgi:hypothetical protein
MRITVGPQKFLGIAPKSDPTLLPGNMAQTAENVKLSGGVLRPWFNVTQEAMLQHTGTIRTIHLYEDTYWLEWEADVNVVLGQTSADTTGRFYYTGHGIPKKSNRTEAITGSGPLPINFYPMGLPVPHNPPIAALGAGGSGDPRNIVYLYIAVSSWNEPGPPSEASNIVAALQGQTVNLSGITMIWKTGEAYTVDDWVYPVATEGGTYVYKCVQAGTSGAGEPTWGTTVDGDTTDNTVIWRCYKNNLLYKWIYRYNTGTATGSFQFVDSININQTTYSDTKLDSDLGSSIPDVDYVSPPDGMIGLVALTNGMMAGFSGKSVYFCEPFKPWSWPVEYERAFPNTIVGIMPMGSTLAVITDGQPWLVMGTHPLSMTPVPLPEVAAGVAKRGIVSHETFVAYPGPDGYYIVNEGGCKLFSREIWNNKQWEGLYPATIHACIQGTKTFVFYSYGGTEGGFTVDLGTGEVTSLDFYTSAVHVHKKTGKLFYVLSPNTQVMPNVVDRDFSGASAWANVNLNAYNETGDLSITANAGSQYCTLPVASAPMTVGHKYRLSVGVGGLVSTWTIKDFTGTQTLASITVGGAAQTFDFEASTTGGFRIIAGSGTSSANFDNFALYDITQFVYEWEGDTTQPRGEYTWKSKKFLLPIRTTFSCARLLFSSADRLAYWALVEAYNAAIARNIEKIAIARIGGAIAEPLIGDPIAIADDELEEPPAAPTYTGADTLTLNVYIKGALEFTKLVFTDQPFRLEDGITANEWEFEIIGNVQVSAFGVANTMKELKSLEG